MKRIFVTITKYLTLTRAICYKKRFFNSLAVIMSYILKSCKISGFPLFVEIEPTNRCNLNCSLCLTGLNKLKRPKRDMTFEEFTHNIDQFEQSVVYLILYNLGEPLLNSKIYDMIKYAKNKKIFVRLSTNGYFTDKTHIKNLVNCGLDELVISLDYISPQAYYNYKKNKGFEQVVDNIRFIVAERKSRSRPFISIQLLLTRENEKEISQFKSLVRRLKVDKALIKKVRVNFPNGNSHSSFLPLNNKYIRGRYKNNYKPQKCIRPWISTVILSDNSVVPCCFDMQGEYNLGNAADLNFRNLWNNKKYIEFRKGVLNNINQVPLCAQCSFDNFYNNFIR